MAEYPTAKDNRDREHEAFSSFQDLQKALIRKVFQLEIAHANHQNEPLQSLASLEAEMEA